MSKEKKQKNTKDSKAPGVSDRNAPSIPTGTYRPVMFTRNKIQYLQYKPGNRAIEALFKSGKPPFSLSRKHTLPVQSNIPSNRENNPVSDHTRPARANHKLITAKNSSENPQLRRSPEKPKGLLENIPVEQYPQKIYKLLIEHKGQEHQTEVNGLYTPDQSTFE